MRIDKIITECEKIYPYTDKRIERAKNQMSDDIFKIYLSDLHEMYYVLINEMIICVQSGNLMIQQRKKMEEFLLGMNDYYFNQLLPIAYEFTDWGFTQDFDKKLEGKQGIFINPKDFNKEYVNEIVSSLTSKKKQQKPFKETDAFLVAIEFANGTIYDLKEEGYSGLGIAKELAKKIKGKKASHFQPYINQTLEGSKNDNHNIYERQYAFRKKKDGGGEELKQVYDHCLENGINMNHIFLENLKELGVHT